MNDSSGRAQREKPMMQLAKILCNEDIKTHSLLFCLIVMGGEYRGEGNCAGSKEFNNFQFVSPRPTNLKEKHLYRDHLIIIFYEWELWGGWDVQKQKQYKPTNISSQELLGYDFKTRKHNKYEITREREMYDCFLDFS